MGKTLSAELAKIGGIVFVSLLLWEGFNLFIENRLDFKAEEKQPSARVRTLLTVGRNALFVALTVSSTLMVLSDLGINIAPLLAGAGVVGLAVGFGSQKLVQDIITGAFILFEDLISVGDVVTVGGESGRVEAITIRTVRLRGLLSGHVHTIPFSTIGTITNMTREFSYYVFDVGIAYREDVDAVIEVLKDLGREMQDDPYFGILLLGPLEILGVDAFASSAVIVKARFKTVPIKQWEVGREFNRRMKKRFDALDIEIPFPHVTVYFGVDKAGNAPPARLDLRLKELAGYD